MKFSIKEKTLLLDENPLSIENLQVLEMLGHGTNAHVFKVYNTSTRRYEALKIWHSNGEYDLSPDIQSSEALSENRPNYVYGAGVVNGQHYCLMEYIDGISLEEFLGQNPDLYKRIFYLKQTLRAFKEIYGQGTFHSEIRADNILIDETNERVFISDLGTSRFLLKGPSEQKNARLLIKLCIEILPLLENSSIISKGLLHKEPLFIIQIMSHIADLHHSIYMRQPGTWDQYSLIQDIVLEADSIRAEYQKGDISLNTSSVSDFFEQLPFPKEKIQILKSWYRKLAGSSKKQPT